MLPDSEYPSNTEWKWIERLERLLDAMPPNLHLLIKSGGSVDVCRPEAVKQYFEENGHLDNAPALHTIYSKNRKRIEPNSESA